MIKTDILPQDFQYVLVVLSYEGKYIFVKNKKRNWEFAGGKRERNETIEEVAKRESYEEAGAIINNIKRIGYYTLEDEYVIIVTADVEKIYPLSEASEISKICLSSKLPNKDFLSFNDGIYEEIFSLVTEKNFD